MIYDYLWFMIYDLFLIYDFFINKIEISNISLCVLYRSRDKLLLWFCRIFTVSRLVRTSFLPLDIKIQVSLNPRKTAWNGSYLGHSLIKIKNDKVMLRWATETLKRAIQIWMRKFTFRIYDWENTKKSWMVFINGPRFMQHEAVLILMKMVKLLIEGQ